MNTDANQLLWKYIDGLCNADERLWIEQKLEAEEDFKAEWEQRKILHLAFQKMESEKPSMRFAANVMDNLPALYQKAILPPLVKPFWRKAFLYSLIGSILILLIVFAISPNAVLSSGSKWTVPEAQMLGNWLNSIPSQLLILVGSISIGSLFLIWLDQKLKHRFGLRTE